MKLKIEKVISSGDGLGWAEGKTFFVPYTIPGELISFDSFQKEKSHFRVSDFDVVEPSLRRRGPVCPLFTRCGGCSLLHMDYLAQVDVKKSILEDLFRQKGDAIGVPVEFLSIGEFGTRSRAKVSIREGLPGFRRRMSHEHVPFESCPLMHPELNRVVRENAEGFGDAEVQFELSVDTGKWLPKENAIDKYVFGKSFHVSRGSFFQSSEKAAEALVSLFLQEMEKVQPETMVDLFCGVGLFSKFASDLGVDVFGMECGPMAVRNFRINLGKKARIEKCDVSREKSFPPADLYVVDPPRSGMGKKVVDRVCAADISEMIYISCDPATFVRDYDVLKKHGFRLKRIAILDLFPATSHFELFTSLTRET